MGSISAYTSDMQHDAEGNICRATHRDLSPCAALSKTHKDAHISHANNNSVRLKDTVRYLLKDVEVQS